MAYDRLDYSGAFDPRAERRKVQSSLRKSGNFGGAPKRTGLVRRFNVTGTDRERDRAMAGRGPNMGVGQTAVDPFADIMQMLEDYLARGPGDVDEEGIRSDIEAMINPVFAARRQAIENLMSRAEQRTAQNRQEVESMYGALSNQYIQQGTEQQAVAQQAAQEAAALQGQLKSNIHGNFSRIQGEQAELFKQLGIESALPEVTSGQMEAQQQGLNTADILGASEQNYLQNQGRTDQAYYAQGAPLAKLEGSNRSSDLMAALEAYLADQGDVINQLEAERSSELARAFSEVTGQAQRGSQEAYSQGWKQLMDLYGIRTDQFERAQEAAQPPEFEDTGVPELDIARTFNLRPQETPAFQEAIYNFMNDEDVLMGQMLGPDDRYIKMTTATRVKIATEIAKQMGLSPQATNALKEFARQHS